MKQITLLLIGALCVSTYSFSQISENKGYIGISLGPSFPVSAYSSTDPTDKEAGYAKTGLAYNLSFGYKLGPNFGIGALLQYQSNAVDVTTLLAQAHAYAPTISWAGTADSWGVTAVMGGFYGSFPVGYNSPTSFEMCVMIGLVTGTSPHVQVTGSNGSVNVTSDQASGSASNVGFLLGAGLKHNFNSSVSLLLNLDYLTSTCSFENLAVVATTPAGTSVRATSFDQPFRSFNLTVGIGILLH